MPEDSTYDAEKCWLNAKKNENIAKIDPKQLKLMALSGEILKSSLNTYTAPIYLANLALTKHTH